MDFIPITSLQNATRDPVKVREAMKFILLPRRIAACLPAKAGSRLIIIKFIQYLYCVYFALRIILLARNDILILFDFGQPPFRADNVGVKPRHCYPSFFLLSIRGLILFPFEIERENKKDKSHRFIRQPIDERVKQVSLFSI